MANSIEQAPGGPLPHPVEPSDENDARQRLALTFDGKTADYFRVWIVNLCLTLLTLGVFSAWAKVRKKRFLYAHTRLDGTPFEYRGRALPILKGRIIAVLVLALWTFTRNQAAWATPAFCLLAAFALPWIIVRSARFHARSTAYRNMSFEFSGDYRAALKMVLGGALLTLATFGLGFPVWRHRLLRFLVQSTLFGGVRGSFLATSKEFMRAYAGGLVRGLAVLLAVLSVVSLRWLARHGLIEGIVVILYFGTTTAYVYAQTQLRNALWNHTQLGPLSFVSRLRVRDVWWLYFTNSLAILLSAGLLVPWAELRMLRYRARRLRVFLRGSFSEFHATHASLPSAVAAEVTDLLELDVSL